jgi:hypothetical protein
MDIEGCEFDLLLYSHRNVAGLNEYLLGHLEELASE